MVRDPQQRSVQVSIACGGCLFDSCEFQLCRNQFLQILQVSWWRLLLTAPMMSRMFASKLCPMHTERLFRRDRYHWLPCQGPVEFDAFLVGPSQGVDSGVDASLSAEVLQLLTSVGRFFPLPLFSRLPTRTLILRGAHSRNQSHLLSERL